MTTLTDQQLATLAEGAGFNLGQMPTMVAIALAESGGNPDAKHLNSNGTWDWGLWQINDVNKIPGNLLDPGTNARAAKTIFDRQGFKAWSTYNSGAYTRYLGRGNTATISVPPPAAGGTVNNAPTELVNTQSLADISSELTSGGTWVRVGEMFLGAGLLLFAILRLTGADQTIMQGAKLAAKVAIA